MLIAKTKYSTRIEKEKPAVQRIISSNAVCDKYIGSFKWFLEFDPSLF